MVDDRASGNHHIYVAECTQIKMCIRDRTKTAYLDDAAGALDVKLSAEDVAYLEEMYVPHPVVGAIKENPAQGVVLLDEKK